MTRSPIGTPVCDCHAPSTDGATGVWGNVPARLPADAALAPAIHLRRMRLGRRPARRDSPPTRRRRRCRWVPRVTCHEQGTGWHTGGASGALTLDRGHAESGHGQGSEMIHDHGPSELHRGVPAPGCRPVSVVAGCDAARDRGGSGYLSTHAAGVGACAGPRAGPGPDKPLVRALVPARCQARFRGFVLAIAARCRRFMRCTPGPIGLFCPLDQCWFSHMPRTPVYRLWVVSGDGAIFVFLQGVSAIVARFLRNLRRISDGRRDAARSYRPGGSRAAHHLRHPHYRHPVLR